MAHPSYEQVVATILQNMPECEDHENTLEEARDIADALLAMGAVTQERRAS